MKTNTKIVYPTLGLIALNCFVLLLTAQALVPPPDGSYPGGNTAEGQDALFSLTTGTFNTTVGFLSGHAFTTGNLNTAVGAGALLLTHADENTANGAAALLNSSGGFANTANGAFALFSDTDGDFNTASGDGALFSNTTGNGNTALGINAGSSVTTASNVICIGADVAGANVDDSCFIGNIRNALVAPDAVPVLIDSAGKLGTTNGSSRRLKKEIKPMDRASEAILALKPVTFYYKTDSRNTPQFGLIAEEVAKVNPALVLRDKSGDIVSVRYDQVNAMLLNEFLKERRKDEAQWSKIDEQDVTIGRLKSTLTRQQKKFQSMLAQQEQQIEALIADLQKVAADVELNKAQSRTVAEK